MYCKRCGSLIDDDSIFCKMCGTRVSGAGPDASFPPSGAPERPAARPAAEPVREKLSPGGEDNGGGGEEEVWEGRRSWKRFWLHYFGLGLFTVGAAAFFFGVSAETAAKVPVAGAVLREAWGVFRPVPLFLALLGFVVVGIKTFVYTRSIRYRLTTDRFFVIRGIVSRTMDELELIRVNDVIMRQGVWERILGIGSVTILSNDETTPEVVLAGIDDPESVKEKIRNAAAEKRAAGLYVERI